MTTQTFDPLPTPNPLPRPPDTGLTSIRDAAKILIAVVIWFAMTDANRALDAAVEYAKLPTFTSVFHMPMLPSTIFYGLMIGILQGIILGIKALDFFWAGPAFFDRLGPVFSSASRIGATFVADFRRAWTSRSSDCPGGNGGNGNSTGGGNTTSGGTPTGGGNGNSTGGSSTATTEH